MASPVSDPVPDPTQDPAIQAAVGDVSSAAPGIVADIEGKDPLAALQAGNALYGQLAPILPSVVKEAKAGYKTTEFWILIAYEGLQQGEVLFPVHGVWQQIAAKVSPILLYILSRGLAKAGVGNQQRVV